MYPLIIFLLELYCFMIWLEFSFSIYHSEQISLCNQNGVLIKEQKIVRWSNKAFTASLPTYIESVHLKGDVRIEFSVLQLFVNLRKNMLDVLYAAGSRFPSSGSLIDLQSPHRSSSFKELSTHRSGLRLGCLQLSLALFIRVLPIC